MDAGDKRVPLPGRARYLNIVYFIESARSHTIRINLRHASWALAAGIVLCAWSLGSILWIASLNREVDGTRNSLESALATVFDYQIKNDKVFELAYPIDATNSYYSETAQLASNNPLADKHLQNSEAATTPIEQKPKALEALKAVRSESTNLPEVKNEQSQHAAEDSNADKSATASAQADAPTKSNAKKDQGIGKLISISAPKITKSDTKMSLQFSITNSVAQKAEGYIWAVAAIQGGNGVTISIIAPNQAKLDRDSGQIASIKAAYRFSIQRFKDKSFEFSIPPGIKDWKLTQLTIGFSDVNGTNTEHVDLPVDSLAINTTSETMLDQNKF